MWQAKLDREARQLPLFDLTLSNPTQVGLPYPVQIPSLLNRNLVLDYSPHPRGHEAARQAISAYYHSRSRPTISPDDLILTASTSEAYSYLFKLLCNPGDEVLIPSPTYPLFDTLADLENIALIRYPLRPTLKGSETVWKADFNFLRKQISTRCKALILVNPNNPTGHICEPDELEQYLQLAQNYQLALIVDEVFCDYLIQDKTFYPLLSHGPLVFTLNGFSKLLALPQLKLGWIHVSGEPTLKKTALDHLEWIADAFLSVNTPVQLAAKDLFALSHPLQTLILNRIRQNLTRAKVLLADQVGVKYLNPEAGWSLILEIKTRFNDEDFVLALIQEYGVFVHAGHLFGFEERCRIVLSLLVPESIFEEGIKRIMLFTERLFHE